MKCKTYNTVAEMATVIKKELDAVDGYGREFVSATVCCRDEMAARFIQEFVKLGYEISVVEIDADRFSDYDKEYFVTVGNDNRLFAEKAYRSDKWNEDYIVDDSEFAYVHESCNSEILNKIDTVMLTEFSIREFGDDEYIEYSDECEECALEGDCIDEGYSYAYSYPDEDFGMVHITVFAEKELPKSKVLEILDRL